MKIYSMGELYTLSELHPEKFTLGLRLWFYFGMVSLAIILLPGALWRKITGRKTQADIDQEEFMKSDQYRQYRASLHVDENGPDKTV